MRSRKKNYFFIILFLLSLILNTYLFFHTKTETIIVKDNNCNIYPTNYCSTDYPDLIEETFPKFKTYSINGENIQFVNIQIKGSLFKNIQKKYGFSPSVKLIRNIQHIIYFFSDFKINFMYKDRISFFFRKSDGKITYLRYKSRKTRSIYEAFLFKTKKGESYITDDGRYLHPCLLNGPFKGCPDIVFQKKGTVLVPVFLTNNSENIYLPFRSRIETIDNDKKNGGKIDVSYSNFNIIAHFFNFGTLNSNLKQKRIYNKGTFLGKSGFFNIGIKSGIGYYLEKKNMQNSTVSPFFFHHIEFKKIKEENEKNLSITVNFYRKLYKKARFFEYYNNP